MWNAKQPAQHSGLESGQVRREPAGERAVGSSPEDRRLAHGAGGRRRTKAELNGRFRAVSRQMSFSNGGGKLMVFPPQWPTETNKRQNKRQLPAVVAD